MTRQGTPTNVSTSIANLLGKNHISIKAGTNALRASIFLARFQQYKRPCTCLCTDFLKKKKTCALSELVDRIYDGRPTRRHAPSQSGAHCLRQQIGTIEVFISHTKHNRQCCVVGYKAEDYKLRSFQDAPFAGYCKIPNQCQAEFMRILTTNMCSKFLDVQEANSCLTAVPNQNFFGRRFENGRHTSITIAGLCVGNMCTF